MNMYLPIILIVVSNIFYNICTKSTPERLNPFAALTVTYCVAAVLSLTLYFVFNRGGSLQAEYKNLNWTPFVLGISAVGLETGFIYMYKAGWNISTGQLVSSALLTVCLIVIGCLVYNEALSVTKIVGTAICIVGLFLIGK